MKTKLDQVKIIRFMIKSKLFTNEQITEASRWLGFSDTAYREKSLEDKLKDFLLDNKYWKKRAKRKVIEPLSGQSTPVSAPPRSFNREELWKLRERAAYFGNIKGTNPDWAKAYQELAYAANVLDAHLARSTVCECHITGVVEEKS